MAEESLDGKFRYSVSLVTQGKHRFYTLTMPSNVLAHTCFVTTRDEDPAQGFQRLLDRDRAQQIADYIDAGLGTIPNSIVLSAQHEADLQVIGKGKTLQFQNSPKAFLILDGQHRVYGFSLARTALRVPVVIYNGLSRQDESRLFIDINTKQRPVPNELLLDIKKLAEYETSDEQMMREVFDYFNMESMSPLLGLMSPTERAAGKISRVTFNAALKPLLPGVKGTDSEKVYSALSGYLTAFIRGCRELSAPDVITNPTVFRAAMLLFPEVTQRVQDRFGPSYQADHFDDVLGPMFTRVKLSWLTSPGRSYRELYDSLSKSLRTNFSL